MLIQIGTTDTRIRLRPARVADASHRCTHACRAVLTQSVSGVRVVAVYLTARLTAPHGARLMLYLGGAVWPVWGWEALRRVLPSGLLFVSQHAERRGVDVQRVHHISVAVNGSVLS